jgi:zinc and cadmium transporter
MLTNQITILLATLIVSFFSLTGISALSMNEKTLHRILFFMVAFSAGSILGASIFDLLPEAVEIVEEELVFIYIAVGFVAFFFLERFIYWYHGHGHHDDIVGSNISRAKTKSFAYLNIFGDGIHNFIDGMIIAASFTVSLQVGIATTIAVIFHELPQEMGDYGILIYAGFSRGKAIILNYAAALSVVVGGLFASIFLETVEALSGLLIAFSAGAFIYLSASELIPELKEETDFKRSIIQFGFFILGLLVIWYLGIIFHHE